MFTVTDVAKIEISEEQEFEPNENHECLTVRYVIFHLVNGETLKIKAEQEDCTYKSIEVE